MGTSADHIKLAERVGFEPTDARTSPVFKTGAFNHSAISPCEKASIPKRMKNLTIVPVLLSTEKEKNFFEKFEKRGCKMQKGMVF